MTHDLYHYTSLDAFEKIVSSQFRLTNVLNMTGDPYELHHGIQIYLATILALSQAEGDQLRADFLRAIHAKICEELNSKAKKELFPNIYILSMSDNYSNEHLWKTYGNSNSGIALQINLDSLPKRTHINLRKIEYNDELLIQKLKKIIYQHLDGIIKESDKGNRSYIITASSKVFQSLTTDVLIESVFFKPEKQYSAEREWRYFILSDAIDDNTLKFDDSYLYLSVKNTDLIKGVVYGKSTDTEKLKFILGKYFNSKLLSIGC